MSIFNSTIPQRLILAINVANNMDAWLVASDAVNGLAGILFYVNGATSNIWLLMLVYAVLTTNVIVIVSCSVCCQAISLGPLWNGILSFIWATLAFIVVPASRIWTRVVEHLNAMHTQERERERAAQQQQRDIATLAIRTQTDEAIYRRIISTLDYLPRDDIIDAYQRIHETAALSDEERRQRFIVVLEAYVDVTRAPTITLLDIVEHV